MEDNWVCKEMMTSIQDAAFTIEPLKEEQKVHLRETTVEKMRGFFAKWTMVRKKKFEAAAKGYD
tara:strand:- start:1411 stop:1602 length:192 start_codon:yes stop_codon:yes gene_type:complete